MKKLLLISIAAVCAAMICSCSSTNKAELSPAYYLTFEIAGEGEAVCIDTCVAEAAVAEADSCVAEFAEAGCTADGEACFVTKTYTYLDEDGNEVEVSEGECVDTVIAPEPGYDYSEPCDPVFDPMAGLRERVEKANANYKSVPVNADEIDGILEEYFVEFQGQVNAEINVYITPTLTANFSNVQKQLFRTYAISSQEAAFEEPAVEKPAVEE